MVKYITNIFIIFEIILSFCGSLLAQNQHKLRYQLLAGVTKGDFNSINNWNKRWGGSNSDNYKLDNGFCGEVIIEYYISKKYVISLDGEYKYFSAHEETEFINEVGQSWGMKDFPIWKVSAIPLSISGYIVKDLNPFRVKIGSGVGVIWTCYQESFPTYGASWLSGDIEYTFSGFAPLLKLITQLEYKLSDPFYIILITNYQYSKIKKLKLSSKENGTAYNAGDVLRDHNQNYIDFNLSGFSILIGIAF